MRFWLMVMLMGGVAYCVSEGANARGVVVKSTVSPMRMVMRGTAEPPIGHVAFCKRYPSDCLPHGGLTTEVKLSDKKWHELVTVNTEINETIKPVSDLDQYHEIEYWTYPSSGKGDCEDYVILKQHALMELGWPMSDLLITVVRDENGEGHAVLTVRTSNGDLILDNKHSQIKAWDHTGYSFIKRQSAADPRRWESLIPTKIGPAIAAAGSESKK